MLDLCCSSTSLSLACSLVFVSVFCTGTLELLTLLLDPLKFMPPDLPQLAVGTSGGDEEDVRHTAHDEPDALVSLVHLLNLVEVDGLPEHVLPTSAY